MEWRATIGCLPKARNRDRLRLQAQGVRGGGRQILGSFEIQIGDFASILSPSPARGEGDRSSTRLSVPLLPSRERGQGRGRKIIDFGLAFGLLNRRLLNRL